MKPTRPLRLIRTPFHVMLSGGRALLARNGMEETWAVPPSAARFLESFSTLSTLEEKLDRSMEGRRNDTALFDLLKKTAHEALRRGFLETETDWRVRHSTRASATEPAARRLDAIWIPSAGRAEVCAHTCGTILANLAHHGMNTPLGVVETPGGSGDGSSTYAAALTQEARRHGRRIRHLTIEGTRRFITALAAESGVEERLLRIALTDDLAPERGQAFGAGRNLIQLLQPRGNYLSFDDDVQCRGWRTETSPGWRLDTGSGGAQLDLLVKGDDWRQPPDRIGPHLDQLGTRWLGLSAAECLTHGGLEEAAPREESLAPRLLGPHGRVRFVYPGTIGDIGMHSKAPFLTSHSSSCLNLLRKAGALDEALSSRFISRTYSQLTVGNFHYISGLCTWIDHDDALPPYFPVGRAEDFLMGRLLPVLDRRALAVYLPYAFLHLPVPDRPAFPSLRLHAPNIYHFFCFGHYLAVTVPALARDYSRHPVSEALERTGRDLAAWRTWHPTDFAAYATGVGRGLISEKIEQLEVLLAQVPSMTRCAREDLEWLISQWRDCLISPARLLPPDLAELCPHPDWSVLQDWLALYGDLMAAWPTVRAAAQRLPTQEGDWWEERG
jgi:hypothetical protein